MKKLLCKLGLHKHPFNWDYNNQNICQRPGCLQAIKSATIRCSIGWHDLIRDYTNAARVVCVRPGCRYAVDLNE